MHMVGAALAIVLSLALLATSGRAAAPAPVGAEHAMVAANRLASEAGSTCSNVAATQSMRPLP